MARLTQQQREDALAAADRAEWLEAALATARAQAAEVRDHHLSAAVSDEDLAELADNALLVQRFLDDVSEALKQLFVAGVAYPDPDLPEELRGLAERAQRNGLAGALEHLLALQAEIETLARETDLFARADRSEAVWQRAQQLVAWLRLFRQELDLSAVQSRLTRQARDAGEPVAARKPRLPAASLSCWPVGLLRRGAKLTLIAQDVDTGQQVTLIDELADVPPQGPFAGLVISRLFREQLNLSVVLQELIRLDDHPFVETGSGATRTRLFRPAFSATPRTFPVAHGFVPPPLPSEPAGQGMAYAAPMLVARDTSGAMHLTLAPSGESAGVYVDRTLRCNLVKLLVREGVDRIDVDAALMETGEGRRLLAITTDFDGRTFPVDDLGLFRMDRMVLARRADADPVARAGDSLAGLVLRGGAFVYGGADADAMARFATQLAKADTPSWPERWLLGMFRAHFGIDEVPARATVKRAIAVVRDAERIKRHTSKGYVTSDDLFGALASLLSADAAGDDGVADLAQRLLAPDSGRYAALHDPSWTDVCVRALLMALGGEAPPAPDGDGGEAPAPDDDDGGPLEFLDAHVGGLRKSQRRTTRQQALPDLTELLRLSYTLRVLTGAAAQEATLADLDLPWHMVLLPAVQSMYRWTVELADMPAPEPRLEAGVALLVVAQAALDGQMVTA